MPRITSLEVLLDPAGKMLLAEAYDGVIENVQKATISGQLKNTDLSGDPTAGTVEAKRFVNAKSNAYGTARGKGKGELVKGKPVTIPIDTDREFIEEVEQKDVSLLGVDGLITRRSANHAMQMTNELDRAFFAECVASGTQFTPSTGTTEIQDIIEEAIVTLETLKNDYIDGIPRNMLSVEVTPAVYSKMRKYLDEVVHNANVDTAAETFDRFHGVRFISTINMPAGCDFIVQVDGSVAQPVRSQSYSAEKIPMSEAYAIELFFYYGTKAVTPETILFYSATGTMTVISKAGTEEGKTALTVSPAKTGTNTYSYKTAESVDVPKLGSTVEGYTAWNGTDEITATTNNDIVVVELTATDSKVVRAGKAKVTANGDSE
uniref:Major capsid protein n=1 Tax=Siphoviridae sp. ctwDi18 TaxID=2827970 RepID=A0A8S5TA20_9CAUD|nr:MAG TPA: major capsid protein [Siphoviridae sp. ctwDi18]